MLEDIDWNYWKDVIDSIMCEWFKLASTILCQFTIRSNRVYKPLLKLRFNDIGSEFFFDEFEIQNEDSKN
jgi:hypothetical protein